MNYFDKLPPEMLEIVGSYLTGNDIISYVLTLMSLNLIVTSRLKKVAASFWSGTLHNMVHPSLISESVADRILEGRLNLHKTHAIYKVTVFKMYLQRNTFLAYVVGPKWHRLRIVTDHPTLLKAKKI